MQSDYMSEFGTNSPGLCFLSWYYSAGAPFHCQKCPTPNSVTTCQVDKQRLDLDTLY